MTDETKPKERRIGRRTFLVGAVSGAAVTALGATALVSVRDKVRKLRTPRAVDAGSVTRPMRR
jgi:hypothetical protein